MTFAEFTRLVESDPRGVVLAEGRRAMPEPDAARARQLASALARRFPGLRFRSGNAAGADEAFSQGVALVDASRLQVVAPYPSHRRGSRYSEASYDSPDDLSPAQEEETAYKTARASPQNRGLVAQRGKKGPLGAKAAYLMRDTMKVTGHSEEYPRPLCALFFVDLADPMAGGTGHTIRVCQQEGVPHAFQDSWGRWPVA